MAWDAFPQWMKHFGRKEKSVFGFIGFAIFKILKHIITSKIDKSNKKALLHTSACAGLGVTVISNEVPNLYQRRWSQFPFTHWQALLKTVVREVSVEACQCRLIQAPAILRGRVRFLVQDLDHVDH